MWNEVEQESQRVQQKRYKALVILRQGAESAIKRGVVNTMSECNGISTWLKAVNKTSTSNQVNAVENTTNIDNNSASIVSISTN